MAGSSAAEAAAQAAVLFTCLPNDAIVRAVYLGAGRHRGRRRRAGLITCDCSTVSPEATLEVHAALAAEGITHMDTPMLGSQPQAVSGEIFFIVGGEQAQLERIAPYLEIMGKLHMYVGGSAMGNRVKLIHNGLAAVTSVAVAEALAVCVQSGVDPDTFYDVVRNGGGMAFGTYFDRRAKRIFDGEFSPTFVRADAEGRGARAGPGPRCQRAHADARGDQAHLRRGGGQRLGQGGLLGRHPRHREADRPAALEEVGGVGVGGGGGGYTGRRKKKHKK